MARQRLENLRCHALVFVMTAAFVGLSACALQPTRETLTDTAGNKTYCVAQTAIDSFINTTIVFACTRCGTAEKCVNEDGTKTVVTFIQGNSIGGAILSTGTAAAAAATGLGLGFK